MLRDQYDNGEPSYERYVVWIKICWQLLWSVFLW